MSYKAKSTYGPVAPDLRLGAAIVELQRRRCAAGEHDLALVPAGRVAYEPHGRRREIGEAYCRCCGATLASPRAKSARTGWSRPGA